jgi:hypothetical protein
MSLSPFSACILAWSHGGAEFWSTAYFIAVESV